jgi:hypothetical protein
LNRGKKDERLSGSPHSRKPDHLPCSRGKGKIPWTTFRQLPVNKLPDNVFQTVTIHEDVFNKNHPYLKG